MDNVNKGLLDILVLAYKIGNYGGLEKNTLWIAQYLKQANCDVEGISISSSGGKKWVEGMIVHRIRPEKLWLRRIYSFFSSWLIPLYIRFVNARPDVILVSHFHFLGCAMKAVNNSRTKIWLIASGIEIWRSWSQEEKEMLEKCDKIIAISNYTADSLKKRLSRSNNVIVIPIGVNINKFIPKNNFPESPPRIILTVGRLSSKEKYKGHDLIIKALKKVKDQINIPFEYHVVGEGDDIARLQGIAEDCGVSDIVKFLGRLEGDEFIREYQHCYVYAMPSYVSQRANGTWTGEGFGIVYLEAAACGKPIIACDIGGQTDVVMNNVTGILVKPTVNDVSDALIELLKNPDKARRMGEEGRRYIEENYSREIIRNKWRDLVINTVYK